MINKKLLVILLSFSPFMLWAKQNQILIESSEGSARTMIILAFIFLLFAFFILFKKQKRRFND